MKKEFGIVWVEWVDSTTRHDVALPFDEAVKEKPVKAQTVGWLLSKDSEKLVLCSFLFPASEGLETGFKTIHIIPASSIIRIRDLEMGK